MARKGSCVAVLGRSEPLAEPPAALSGQAFSEVADTRFVPQAKTGKTRLRRLARPARLKEWRWPRHHFSGVYSSGWLGPTSRSPCTITADLARVPTKRSRSEALPKAIFASRSSIHNSDMAPRRYRIGAAVERKTRGSSLRSEESFRPGARCGSISCESATLYYASKGIAAISRRHPNP